MTLKDKVNLDFIYKVLTKVSNLHVIFLCTSIANHIILEDSKGAKMLYY